jgi:hypothetical protein
MTKFKGVGGPGNGARKSYKEKATERKSLKILREATLKFLTDPRTTGTHWRLHRAQQKTAARKRSN